MRVRHGVMRLGIVIPGLLVVACATSEPAILVGLLYAPPKNLTAMPPSVVVHLSPVVDARSDPEAIGHTTVIVRATSDVLAWVREGLLTLGEQGYELSMSGSDPPEGFRLRVTVTRVYCRSVVNSLRSSVVLVVEYFRGGELVAKRQHRGESTYQDMGLFSGTYRFNEARVLQVLNDGLGNAVAQIAATLKELGGG